MDSVAPRRSISLLDPESWCRRLAWHVVCETWGPVLSLAVCVRFNRRTDALSLLASGLLFSRWCGKCAFFAICWF
jgi:hypothetical protein